MTTDWNAIDAVVLDVGGVLLVPRAERVAPAVADFGVRPDGPTVERAHYEGVVAIDRATVEADARRGYAVAYARALGVGEAALERAADVLRALWAGPSPGLWTQPVAGSLDGLRRLAECGRRLAIVSNADGTVEALLRAEAICQIGEGAGVPVCAIVDSAVVGVAKPDPGIFRHLVERSGIAPERAVYVGDTVRYDVTGARAAGLVPIHFDPYARCERRAGHVHVRSLGEVADLLGAPAS
jgi:putative hydrolase of the HAD superfamily